MSKTAVDISCISNEEELFDALKKWSYSKINTLKICPNKFYRQYILKEKGTAPVAFKTNLGRAVHKLIEDTLNGNSIEKTAEKVKERYGVTDGELMAFKENAETIAKRIENFNKEFKMAQCPVCSAEITVADDAMEGELITCPDCGSELEITSLSPVTLSEAPMEEEDWGQ
ncbi:MAG: lysine biosynthesis protein LysW [Candidatus Dadabacteria bacterium]|nr:MAG: lysine biosynthesis protein LysW [Candidatus Dadabacteria bacterium]